ncbi:hypothetical protein GCM10007377_05640 [Galliscardovia ingluviei]|uniref:Uncharacterized protein n=1 Tax=Galliscardovia ingluviei TaxID=1769422 RepID=A0A8J3AID9_9BIFI|nr:hypothetical protein [Galliscardovia ingluviei]GGI13374.1 hypothetical protein GCM10007377_05640 [Galliscardovia ingluviei]
MSTHIDTFDYAQHARQTAQADLLAQQVQLQPRPTMTIEDNSMVVHCEFPSILGCGGTNLRLVITRLVPQDMAIETCVQLAKKTCSLSCAITEVIRGRVEIQLIERYIDEQDLRQIQAMAHLLQGESSQTTRNLPIVPMFVHATVVNDACFDATIGIGIGSQLHLTSLVLRLRGSRWIATHISVS